MKASLGGVHHLVTGLNGHGKTLYVVACILRPLVGTTLAIEGQEPVKRRLMVSGIKGLALEHHIVDAPKVDPERFVDEWKDHVREPGDPPLDVHHQVQNWWCWAMPGDVIVIDECQRVFRPMASGRRVPTYIEKLETARHYGVQFLYITQKPHLLHSNVRQLVGPHEHVARIFGGVRTIIYQWDECSNPDRIKHATKRYWPHDKTAFGLYESAQAHTSFTRKLPAAVFGLVGGLVVLFGLGWYLKDRLFNPGQVQTPNPSVPAPAPGAVTQLGNTAPGQSRPARPGGQVSPAVPRVLGVSAPLKFREPYSGFGVHLVGSYQVGDEFPRAWFSLSIDGRAVGTLRDTDMHRAGYAWRQLGPCVGVLAFAGQERVVTCDAPAAAVDQARPARPAPSASAPL